jgi:hypothetical protein
MDFMAGISTGKITGKSIARRSISLPLDLAARGARSVIEPEIGMTANTKTKKVSKKLPSRLNKAKHIGKINAVIVKTRIRFESIFAVIICDALSGEAFRPSIVSKSNSLKKEVDPPAIEVKRIIKRIIWEKNLSASIEKLNRNAVVTANISI